MRENRHSANAASCTAAILAAYARPTRVLRAGRRRAEVALWRATKAGSPRYKNHASGDLFQAGLRRATAKPATGTPYSCLIVQSSIPTNSMAQRAASFRK